MESSSPPEPNGQSVLRLALPATVSSMLWLTFPLVSLSAKCFMTTTCAFRYPGADYAHPLSAATLHLLLVGSVLWFGGRTCGWIDATFGRRDDEGQQLEDRTAPALSTSRASLCLPVGLAFGCKYVVGHYALQVTPTPLYELFHCLNLFYVAIFANLWLGERLHSTGEVMGCIGVVIGSGITVQEGFFAHGNDATTGLGWLALALNLLNGVLASCVVVLLRWTLLRCQGHVSHVTSLKMIIGGGVLLPFAALFEQLKPMTWYQAVWWGGSSVAILLYHLTLSVLCLVATAHEVAIVEALRPVPAFWLLALFQKMSPKSSMFWIGSAIVLVSAIGFELSRRSYRDERCDDDDAMTCAGLHEPGSRPSCSSGEQTTENTGLL